MPDVLGDNTSSWALPCVPYAGDNVGLFLIPPSGTQVWVEFEQGDLDYPIWSGCFWGDGKAPDSSPAKKILKTPAGSIVIDDSAGSAKASTARSPRGGSLRGPPSGNLT